MRRATQAANGLANAPPEISIHALLAESDTRRTYHKDESQEFLSTLSLRRATGILAISLRIVFAEFLSTLSLRRATSAAASWFASRKYFYPRSPCGERRHPCFLWPARLRISIHALLAESDYFSGVMRQNPGISIHALLAESDSVVTAFRGSVDNFYPRSPCGERLSTLHDILKLFTFLSTLSLRRATISYQYLS